MVALGLASVFVSRFWGHWRRMVFLISMVALWLASVFVSRFWGHWRWSVFFISMVALWLASVFVSRFWGHRRRMVFLISMAALWLASVSVSRLWGHWRRIMMTTFAFPWTGILIVETGSSSGHIVFQGFLFKIGPFFTGLFVGIEFCFYKIQYYISRYEAYSTANQGWSRQWICFCSTEFQDQIINLPSLSAKGVCLMMLKVMYTTTSHNQKEVWATKLYTHNRNKVYGT